MNVRGFRDLVFFIVGKNHCTHALIIDVRISDNRLYHEAQGDYTFFLLEHLCHNPSDNMILHTCTNYTPLAEASV